MTKTNAALASVDDQIEQSTAKLFELLRIKSISTDPAYKKDCKAAADWLVDELTDIGFEASRRDTTGHPMVVAHAGPETGPHVLFYGHYDVQPVDPLNLWQRDPFDPAIEETSKGKVIRARGSSDDKGQLMTFVEACRAWMATNGALPVRVTLFFEGEEESGSPSLVPFMETNRDELTADVALICDTDMWDADTPAICTMLRGLVGEEIVITGATRDLHSGMYGGPAANPIRVLSKILASLHDDTGRVTLPGFYDGVEEVPGQIAGQWESLAFNGADFLAEVGLSTPAGEQDRPALHQIWARPTCEFNGISGGYTGDGFKTVLPSQARAKVSCRLVGTQDPHAIRVALQARVREMLPPDCKVEFHEHGASPASVMSTDNPAFERARAALSQEWPKDAFYTGGGGSIPIAGHFKQVLDMDAMLIGFAQDDDQIHSPNEKYDLRSFHKGIRSWTRILGELAR